MTGIKGCRVLVVEDEFFLAHDLCEELSLAGADVVGPAGSLAEALDMVTRGPRPDAALLDVRLRHLRVDPILSVLRRQGVPCLLVTGDPLAPSDPTLADVPLMAKPVAAGHVLARLEEVLAGRACGPTV